MPKDSQEELHVLVVEDNADDMVYLEHHLSRIKGRKVIIEFCLSLSEGLKLISRGWADIVFLDLSLSDSWGIETVRKVHRHDPSLPIVILTGTDDDDIALEAINAGAQDYLVKGQLNPSLLGRSINYAIQRQRSVADSQWYSAVIENSNYAVVGTSLENNIISWNRGAEKMFGYQASEVMGQSINMLMPEDDLLRDFWMALYKNKYDHSLDYAESTGRTKDGRNIIISLSASPIKDTDGVTSAISVFLKDITEEKHLGKALRESNSRLDFALKAAKLGQWNWDLHDNTVSWNSGMYELFGVHSDRFIPTLKSFFECVHPDDRKIVIRTLKLKALFDFDLRIVWTDGSVHHITLKGDVLRDASGRSRQVSGVCFDISERKATERALRDSEHRLRLALESAKMGVWDWNLEGATVSRSPLHDYIYGYEDTLPDWSYEKFLTRVLPDDLPYVQKVIDKGVAEGNFNLECRIIHAGDQSVRWVAIRGETSENDSGKPTRIIGTIKDITESKRLEQLALESQEKREQTLRAIVQHAPIGIVILDSELKIMDTNASFNSMIGQDSSRMINQPIAVLIPHDEIRAAKLQTKQGKPVRIARLEMSCPHQPAGYKNYWDVSLWPILRGGDIFSGAVLQIIDCTQTVLLERQRDDFVASVAHDIKNPLVGASRILDMMCSSAIPPAKYASYIGVLRESNQNLLSLVQNLVDIYRYETISYPCYLENVSASQLFDSCIQQLAHFAEQNNVSLRHNSTSSDDSFIADAVGIRRVVMNLLHNAIKFNKNGGRVEVCFENIDDFSRISVTDTGDGISESDQELLFQRFSQGSEGKRLGGGTGLGLHLSKQIIDAHHGEIRCTSEKGKGSTFVITLPRKKAV